MEIVGIIGSILMAVCALPQLVYTLKTGDTSSLSRGFIAMWWAGELCLLVYLFSRVELDWILILNYAANFGICCVLGWFKLNENKKGD